MRRVLSYRWHGDRGNLSCERLNVNVSAHADVRRSRVTLGHRNSAAASAHVDKWQIMERHTLRRKDLKELLF